LMFEKDQAYIHARQSARRGEVVSAPEKSLVTPADSPRVVRAGRMLTP
jgi:hypothetical protein